MNNVFIVVVEKVEPIFILSNVLVEMIVIRFNPHNLLCIQIKNINLMKQKFMINYYVNIISINLNGIRL